MLEMRLKSAFAELLAFQTVIGKNVYPREPELLGEFQTVASNQGCEVREFYIICKNRKLR